jgi:hypothetical protein
MIPYNYSEKAIDLHFDSEVTPNEDCTFIGAGTKGSVLLEPNGQIARKIYNRGTLGSSLEDAVREFHIMRRFSGFLDTIPYLSCPRPLNIIGSDPPMLRMEVCSGTTVWDFFNSEFVTHSDDDHLIAFLLAQGLTYYLGLFDEPYYDFDLQNTLWDPSNKTLSFLDFGYCSTFNRSTHSELPHLTISLGNLLGSTCYHMSRPSIILRRCNMVRTIILVKTIIETVTQLSTSTGHIDYHQLRSAAWAKFQTATARPVFARRAWYLTFGRMIFFYCIPRMLPSYHYS